MLPREPAPLIPPCVEGTEVLSFKAQFLSPPWDENNRFQMSLALSKQKQEVVIYSLSLKQKGLNSGTRRGSTAPHARSGRKRRKMAIV